jgi:Na+/alanine symporter
MGKFNGKLAEVLFWPVPFGTLYNYSLALLPFFPATDNPGIFGIPLIICVLVSGGVFFTFRYGWINIRLFRHGIDVVRGRYDRPDDEGEVSHFKALSSALSATVGLGNIAGVAVAISLGGPGAVFWMWVTAIFGMSLKFSSCTFAQLHRRVHPDGRVLGGPMVYLDEGLNKKGPMWGVFGKILAILFAILTIFASFGGGNMYQGNQTYGLFVAQFFYRDGVVAIDEGGLQVASSADTALSVRVNPGSASIVTKEVIFPAPGATDVIDTLAVTVPQQNPRIDLVYLDIDGTIGIKNGEEAADPVAAEAVKGQMPLAQVYSRPSMTTIATADTGANGYIIDARTPGSLEKPGAAVAFLAGILLAIPAGLVLLGGIKRIGEVTSRMVPAMCLFYCTVCTIILLINIGEVPAMFASIFREAFAPSAVISGGMITVLVQGMRRAAFSNEAGLGSAAIAHAAAKTNEPVREGVVAMLGPFIDTIVVCTMTALTILVTRSHTINPNLEGIELTALAFGQLGSMLPYFLLLAVVIFAFSTLISWGYYGERATEYLFGKSGIRYYRICYVGAVVLGPVLSLQVILDFSDFMLLSMVFPNVLGMLFMSGQVKRLKDDYVRRLRTGEMKRVK